MRKTRTEAVDPVATRDLSAASGNDLGRQAPTLRSAHAHAEAPRGI